MRNSVRPYFNYAHMLLPLARELGRSSAPSPAELAWQFVRATVQTAQLPNGCDGLIRLAGVRNKTPEGLDDADLNTLVRCTNDTGRRPKYAWKVA